jgi:hypothetical protein
MEILP